METRLKKFGTLFIDNKPYQTSDIVAPTELDGRKMEIGDTVPGFEIEWVENHGIYVPRMPLCSHLLSGPVVHERQGRPPCQHRP